MKFIDNQNIQIIYQGLLNNLDGGDSISLFDNLGIYGGNTISIYDEESKIDGGSASD